MPPVEAMVSRALVITTNTASIREVTAGLAIYVRNPYDPKEWADMISMEGALPHKQAVMHAHVLPALIRRYKHY